MPLNRKQIIARIDTLLPVWKSNIETEKGFVAHYTACGDRIMKSQHLHRQLLAQAAWEQLYALKLDIK